jgi:hypothetical protein
VTNALGVEHPPLLQELERAILPWRDTVLQYTADALTRSMEELSLAIKEWAGRVDPGSRDRTISDTGASSVSDI